jgi:hypothetical protein
MHCAQNLSVSSAKSPSRLLQAEIRTGDLYLAAGRRANAQASRTSAYGTTAGAAV